MLRLMRLAKIFRLLRVSRVFKVRTCASGKCFITLKHACPLVHLHLHPPSPPPSPNLALTLTLTLAFTSTFVHQYFKIGLVWAEEKLKFKLSDSTLKLFKLLFTVLLIALWVGCIIFMIEEDAEFPEGSWTHYFGLQVRVCECVCG